MTNKIKTSKKAEATLESVRKVFSLPESEDSTLSKIEKEISQNLLGFLRNTIVAGEMEPAEIEKEFRIHHQVSS